MKKMIFGMLMFLTGALSVAMILVGSGKRLDCSTGIIPLFGIYPDMACFLHWYLFAGMAILGLIVAVWGLFDHKS